MSIDYHDAASANATHYTERLKPGQIRLLCIDPILGKCSFETHELADAPNYICISYTWGEPERGGHVSQSAVGRRSAANGQDESQETALAVPLPSGSDKTELAARKFVNDGCITIDGKLHRISPNLVAIVCKVAEYGDVERVWIDALCINQIDPTERSDQVDKMGQIYNSATFVAVWLGWDERDEVDTVVDICDVLQAEFHRLLEEADGSEAGIGKITNLFEAQTKERLGLSFVDGEAWLAFARFWDRRWFHRAWIVQEIALSKAPPRFFWGHWEIDSGMLYDVSRFLINAEIGLSTGDGATSGSITRPREWFVLKRKLGETLAKARALKSLAFEDGELHEGILNKCETLGGWLTVDGRARTDCARLWTHLLEIYRAFDATDPRDHVYATLGIIKAIATNYTLDLPGIVVDYTRTVPQVYADAVRHIMEKGDCVNIISLAQDPKYRNRSDLPSWIPDFSAGTEMPILMTEARRWYIMPKLYCLAQEGNLQSRPRFKVHADLQRLSVIALPVDKIVAVGECHDEITNKGLWEKTAQILLSRDKFSTNEPDESPLESLWRAMVANTSSEGDIAPAEMSEDFRAFMIASLVTKLMHDPKHLDKLPSLKILIERERASTDGKGGIHALIPTFEEVLDLAAEADRRWTRIEAGDPPPAATPLASRAARFANATKPMFFRRIVSTSQGYLGIGPASTMPGDLLWLMPGIPLPFVLRKMAEAKGSKGGATFTLLGESYLHGDLDYRARANEWQWIEIE